MDLVHSGRILYVSMADVSQPNGPGVNEREFLLSLYEQFGDRMHAVLPSPKRDCDEIDYDRSTLYPNPSRWDLFGYLRQQWVLYRLLQKLSKTGGYDLIVARLSLLPIAFWLVSWYRFPYVVKTLGAVQGFVRNQGLKGLVAKGLAPLNGWLFHGIIKRALAVDCCTETHFHEHRKDYSLTEQRLQVIENATNVTRFIPQSSEAAKQSLGLSQFSPILGFVGGSPGDRGGQQMLSIASLLMTEFPELGVVIVGEDKAGELRERARKLKLLDRVVLPGLVAYEQIPAYVNSFDIGYALDRPERMVTTGNSYQKVRQYLSCGIAVVTCVEEKSELQQQSLVESVHPDDLEALVSATRRLLRRDQRGRAQHAVRAPEFIKKRLSTQYTLSKRMEFWSLRLRDLSATSSEYSSAQ